MTMSTKAKRFRIRRTGNGVGTTAGRARPAAAAQPSVQGDYYQDDGLGPGTQPRRMQAGGTGQAGPQGLAQRPQSQQQPPQKRTQRPGAQSAQAQAPGQPASSARDEIEAIKAENLTGRQLRMARRMAERHGIAAASDYDAVRLLRKQGIDPFKRQNMLELVVSDNQPGQQDRLPATIRQPKPPSTEVIDESTRAREIMQIQRDLVRRRRLRTALLFVRLFFFVFIPTLVAGYYYYNIATPMYATTSEFVIQQADSPMSGAAGGLLSGTSFATSQDSITVQSYLQSREAMARLIKDHDFKKHFQQAFIDPIQRLSPDATNEDAYRLYKRHVRIGYDPSEGIIKMEVIAASPEASVEFSRALISYAEEQVDQMTQRKREDQMRGAMESYQDAEKKMQEAQRRVLELQEKRGVLSADMEVSSRMQQISQFEVELKKKRLELAAMLDNPRPNATKVEIARKEIARLERLVQSMRNELTQGSNSSESLAAISGELVVAQADLQTRQLLVSQALQQLTAARIEANRQVRYLSLGVSPVAPDEPTYPRKFENTMLAFLIFGGIYLMASLTAAILREQVAS